MKQQKITLLCLLTSFFLWLLPTNAFSHESLHVVAIMNTGVNPAGIAITPDGKTAYVANQNNYGITGQNTVTVLDLENNSVKDTIAHEDFQGLATITIHPSEKRAYASNSDGSTISIINTKNNHVIGKIIGFDGPDGMVITRDGKRGYVNNYGAEGGVGNGKGNTVSVVDLEKNVIIGDPIQVGLAPAAIAISHDGAFVYVMNYVDGNPGTGSMSIIKTNNNKVIATIHGFFGPFSLAITPDDKFAYVTNFGSNNFQPFGTTVSVVNLKKEKVVRTIDLGIQPSGVAITSDGKFACVTNYNALYDGTVLAPGVGTMNIIDISKNEIIANTIHIGSTPGGIAIAPDNKHAYITSYVDNTTYVVDLKPLRK